MNAKRYYAQLKSLFILILLSATLGACATVEGAGKDLEKAGQAIQDAVNN
ncbi:Predicted small secreted protein [Colwellia chukchiensis]|uniref:Predicted small secreted protein n=1 Tax=Colwellia chukchiensis TaxID=641665 RepID=A0A1H7PCC7_9GAMM|nr:entericidin A/B family lipoprotein [Colwellia chukchiensis]SEL33108.1 Predicted small secreted protein [Colwellia chukchiensis]